jgi:protease stability complex PrcB-like protein
VRAAFRRCSRTVSRSACSALLASLLVACGSAGAPASSSPSSASATGARDVPFTTVALTGNSRQDGGAAVIVGTTDKRSDLIRSLVPTITPPAAGATLVAVFEGEQRTGGYAIQITSVARDGDRLIVRATFTQPPPSAIVTEVITSPAHVVSVASAQLTGVKTAILLDSTGTERARADLA